MGLESATFISQLVQTNPVSTDKKNQGDDHLRMLKTVLQTTFPNAAQPVYFPSVLFKTANYTVQATDDQAIILCDTTTGAITVTLPTPTYAGWSVRIMKSSIDVNPVFIVPPSGNINGLYAKLRCGIPQTEMELFWSGTTFFRRKPAGEVIPGVVEWFAAPIVTGYILAQGSSQLRADFPELFNAIGTTYGAVDGTHFTLPHMIDRFPVAAGNLYGLGATGGEATHALSIAELAAHAHAGTTDNGGVDHTHPETLPPSTALQGTGLISPNNGWTGAPGNTGATGSASAYLHPHTFTSNIVGSGTAHENRPPYFGLYPFLRAC